MSRKEDIEKLNNLVAEVNVLAKKIRNDYVEEQEDNVLADYKSAFKQEDGNYVYYLDFNSEVYGCPNVNANFPYSVYGNVDKYDNPYHMYLSEEYANKAAKMKKFNDMLLAFKWCYDRTYEPDWGDSDSQKYFIYYDTVKSIYAVDSFHMFVKNDVYFSTRIGAKNCANWLNKIDPKGELVK